MSSPFFIMREATTPESKRSGTSESLRPARLLFFTTTFITGSEATPARRAMSKALASSGSEIRSTPRTSSIAVRMPRMPNG